MREELAEESLASGVPYNELLDEARAADLAGEPLLTTLARLERRLNEVESLVRAHDGRRPARASSAAPGSAYTPITPPLESPAHAEGEVERVPTRRLTDAPQIREPVDLESLITGRVLAWAGGIAIALGAAFFLSVAFSNGWIGPAARVIIGVVASLVMISAGAWFFERREALFGHVLVATSLGVMSLSLVAATRLYDFVPAQIGVLAALAVAAIAAAISIRANSQTVAAFGLITALLAPPLVGASASYSTLAFVAAALVGTVAVSLYRSWTWLPPLAFLLSAPQAAEWLTGDVRPGIALAVLAGFWLLYTVSAGGEEFRRTTDRLSPSTTSVMILNAAFLVALGFEILSGNLDGWRGLFLTAVALAHGAIGGHFLYRRHLRHPFGMLTFGTGVAALSMAVPVQFGGPPVPLAWAAQAAALVWVYSRRQHGYSAALALVLAAMAVGHLFLFEYPLLDMASGVDTTWPFINSSGLTLAFLLAALAVAGYFLKGTRLAALLVISGGVLVALSVPFELRAELTVVVWSALAAGGWILARAYPRDERPYLLAARGFVGAGAAVTLAGIATPARLFVTSITSVDHPLFLSGASLALASLVASLAVGIWTRRSQPDAPIMATVGAALAVYLLSVGIVDEFQTRVGEGGTLDALQKQSQVALSILWASLGVLSFVAGLIRQERTARTFGLALLALATIKVFVYDLASLDASYRVLSFIGLGVILLASSFAYQHFMPLFERQVRSSPATDEPTS